MSKDKPNGKNKIILPDDIPEDPSDREQFIESLPPELKERVRAIGTLGSPIAPSDHPH